jgi:hypothetical protein
MAPRWKAYRRFYGGDYGLYCFYYFTIYGDLEYYKVSLSLVKELITYL